jgi:hypothetical protein
MRRRASVGCLVFALASCASAPPPAPVRSKPTPRKEGVPAELLPALARAERIGRLLYDVDHAADVGTAFLAEEVSEGARGKLAGSATVLEHCGPGGARSFVSLFLTKEAPPRVAYRVHMPAGDKPKLEEVVPPVPADAALLAQLRARETVIARMPKWNGAMKVIALPGELVEAPGALVVYALRQDEPGKIVLGMHFRAFVSRDGATLDRVEALSDIPEAIHVSVGDGIPATSTFRIGYPSEADVFVSLAHDELPIALTTRRFNWLVVGASVGLWLQQPPDLDDVKQMIHRLDFKAANAGMPASDLPKTLR